ncbi:2-dehydro-3-deoxyglucarate aldolase [Cupriavidus sp. AcVe19-6a]|uniref:2-dehydro-3-deoxyglucarate aldolase n=1 Tax=Cupriavidus sp. AcVe19-6a TaxID=2821358 RepID=UPI001AE4B250|nr:2-dehydro-3-deoxyglucarate aldolase [Cupriavidus sp. AcVe19-6a]MBP0639150.1 2-dehydro-3-deoxyglucarate aldolase [Cupriavidus sp. AcVe19-6a]
MPSANHPRAPYSPLPNTFRAAVLGQQRQIGCWCSLASPVTTEIVGVAGFDWLLLDTEHAPNDPLTLLPQLMALKDSVSAPVVRPAWNDPILLKRLLDLGFYNFLIPFVESAEQARQAVSATRYPPLGTRGVAMTQRSNRYGTMPGYFERINDNLCVLVQIESRKDVDAAEEICAVEGVDGIFIGPNDLAAACGHLGNPNHPEVQAEVGRIFRAARQAGKAVGTLTPVEADARRYLDMGASFVAVGLDHVLLRQATQALRDRFADRG